MTDTALMILGMLIEAGLFMLFIIELLRKVEQEPKKVNAIAKNKELSNTIPQLQDITEKELEDKFPVFLTREEKNAYEAYKIASKDEMLSDEESERLAQLVGETFKAP